MKLTRSMWGVAALATLLSTTGLADTDSVKSALEAKVPKLKIDAINETPIEGLYELISQGSLIYVSKDGEYVIDGEMIKAATGENLTAARRGALILAAFEDLGEDNMIQFEGAKDGETPGDIYVFTDHTCGYCQKLHSEIDTLNSAGINVHYLLYPRAGKGSSVHREMIATWCEDDRKAALSKAKQGSPAEFSTECENPIEQHIDLAELAGLRGTPLIITAKGQTLNGYLPADELIAVVAEENAAQ